MRPFARFYYLSNNLNELEQTEHELETLGIRHHQIHVLSEDHLHIRQHSRLQFVPYILRKNFMHACEVGAMVGFVLSILVLMLVFLFGWAVSVGWAPFIFLALVLLGFSTWEGGLYGIQKPNRNFVRFSDSLRQGVHVFFVDIQRHQHPILESVMTGHPNMAPAGIEDVNTSWWRQLQCNLNAFFNTLP